MHVKAQAINIFGCLYDADRGHPDQGKVNAAHALPMPTSVTKLQEFLGLVTYLPLHPWFVHLDCPSAWTSQEGHRLHLELHLWCNFSAGHGSCHQWHHPQVFWPFTSHDNTSWCLTGRPWSSTPAEWQTHGFCQQDPYWNWVLICQHRERDATCHLWSREIPIPNICLW